MTNTAKVVRNLISFDQFSMESGVPIYLQIIGYIKRGIVAGTIVDGDEVPSRRMLSALLGVNPNTVQKSYAMLEEEGLMVSRSGAKSFIQVDETVALKLRQEILSSGVRELVAAMKQMGLSKDQALRTMEEFWEVEP